MPSTSSSTAQTAQPSHMGTYLKLILTAVFWGGTWIAGRVVVQEVPPFSAACVRFVIAAVATLGLVYWKEGSLPRPNRKEAVAVIALGVTGIFLYNYFFLHGLQHISAGRGALVVALNPAVIALVAWVWLGERMSALKSFGIALALFGCLFVITNGAPLRLLQGQVGIGEWMIVGCVAAWTLYTFIGRSATRTLSPLVVNLYAYVVGCALLGVSAWLTEPGGLSVQHYSLTAWLCIGYLGIFGTALSYAWFTDGVKRIGAARAAAFINLVPVAGVALGALMLQERLHPAVLAGGGLTIVGVWLTNRSSSGLTAVKRSSP